MVVDEISFEVQLSGNSESNFVFSVNFTRGRIEATPFLWKIFPLFLPNSIFFSQRNSFDFFFPFFLSPSC